MSRRTGTQPGPSALAEKLMALGYGGLFQSYDESALNAIWDEPGAPEALAGLVLDAEAPALARFLAAEILFSQRETYPPQEHKPQLASVYAAALAGNFTEVANAWGLPEVVRGSAGEHFVALGDAAVPALLDLAEDDRRVYYAGSQEATLGNSYRYRVKDLAAFYISQITGLPFTVDPDPEKRDASIEELKRSLR
jgi:hypothetical protein